MQLCAATLGCRVPRATLGSFPPLTLFLTPLSHPPPPLARLTRLHSWACVEVPRYTFYAVNLFMDVVPLPLFFLRYNLFMVLYPSGITGTYAVR